MNYKNSKGLYAEAGAVAEQAIASIRTVAAFTGERKEADRYALKLERAQGVGIQSGTAIARGLACVLFIIFASYGLGMWFGAKVREGCVVCVCLCICSCAYRGPSNVPDTIPFNL